MLFYNIQSFILLLPAILIAITIHEFAHAKVADVLGDPTPRYAGRLTLNPIAHIDPIGFLMLLLVRFGWAKPVPINPYNFANPAKGSLYVSLAGPLSNFLLAWIAGIIFKFLILYAGQFDLVISFLASLIFINLALGVFNLIPIPPLDGANILEYFIPPNYYYILENLKKYGFIILILILFVGRDLLIYAISFLFHIITYRVLL